MNFLAFNFKFLIEICWELGIHGSLFLSENLLLVLMSWHLASSLLSNVKLLLSVFRVLGFGFSSWCCFKVVLDAEILLTLTSQKLVYFKDGALKSITDISETELSETESSLITDCSFFKLLLLRPKSYRFFILELMVSLSSSLFSLALSLLRINFESLAMFVVVFIGDWVSSSGFSITSFKFVIEFCSKLIVFSTFWSLLLESNFYLD